MKLATHTVLACAVLFAAGLGGAAVSFTRTEAADAPKAAATPVAVVQIRQVMKGTKLFEAMQESQKKSAEAVEKELKTRRDALTSLQSQAKELMPDSPAYQKLDAQFSEGSIQLEGWVQFQKKKLGRSDAAALIALYKQACLAAGEVAEQKGYDILLAETITPEQLAKGVALEDADRVVNGDREVIWSRKSADITSDVIAKMNNDFNQRGAAAPAAPASIAAPAAPTTLTPTVPAPQKP